MPKHRVARTGRPMLTFFGDLIAKTQRRCVAEAGYHEYLVRLYRTEAPGYVLAVRYDRSGTVRHWAAHTPNRLEVAGLFDRCLAETGADAPAAVLLRDAAQDIMLQAPELDELVHWSSSVAREL